MNNDLEILTNLAYDIAKKFIELSKDTLDFNLDIEDCFPATIYQTINMNGQRTSIKAEFSISSCSR